jgi:kynurenine formamidase
MKVQLKWAGNLLEADLARPLNIAIPLKEGAQNPNCYFAERAKFEVIKGEGFIGSIKHGGTVNHKKITLSPHGNGTHTECYGHITDNDAVIANQVTIFHHVAQLISVTPQREGEDLIIDKPAIEKALGHQGIKALVIRTLPNDTTKLQYNYSGTNPAFFTKEAMQFIVGQGILHLVTDLPSIDREVDGGKLLAHKHFWQIKDKVREDATITELAFIADNIKDGLYLLNLQVLPIHLDASPSNPILYSLSTITE